MAPDGFRARVTLPATLALVFVIQSCDARSEEPDVPAFPHRLRAAAEILELDPVRPMPPEARPRSSEPVAGVAFVSCTRLWVALPDGSLRRRIVSMRGVSSPTFAPDARTVAFLLRRGGADEIWMAGADGSAVTRVGAITEGGRSPGVRATSLAWSPNGRRMAFALMSPNSDPWAGGSVVWVLHFQDGTFHRTGSAWPTPLWTRHGLQRVAWRPGVDPRHLVGDQSVPVSRRMGRGLDRAMRRVTASAGSGTWAMSIGQRTAVIRRMRGDWTRLALRTDSWAWESVSAPSEYVIAPSVRPAVSGRELLLVELDDRAGERDVGVYDLEARTWSIVGEASEPTMSPAPTSSGSIEAARAVRFARYALKDWTGGESRIAGLTVGIPRDPSFVPLDVVGMVTQDPRRKESGWVIPVTVFGRTHPGFSYRHVSVLVHGREGRLVVDPLEASSVRPIGTVEQAVRFLERALAIYVVPPAGLPAGARLDAEWPLWAWGDGHTAMGELRFEIPSGSETRSLLISYGDVYPNVGCGAEVGRPGEIEDTPAQALEFDGNHQVLWPVRGGDVEQALYSVYGEQLPEDVVLRVAEAMAASS